MPGLIAMMSVFVVVSIEMFFASRGAGHVHSTDYETLGLDGSHAHPGPAHKRSHSYGRYTNRSSQPYDQIPGIVLHEIASSDNLMAGRSPSLSLPSPRMPQAPHSQKTTKSFDDDDDDAADDNDDDDLNITPEELGRRGQDGHEDETELLEHPHRHKHLHNPQDSAMEDPDKTEAQNKKLLLQCLLLEAGILFHSVFIGMALSVATGTSFIVLLVAISFHQTFEGFALGSRISAIRFPVGSLKPWLMALAYGTTTPIGQAIGLAIHTLYDPASQTGLLTVGFMNAISSGLLLFAGLVELLAEDFLSDESYVTLQGKRRLQACASVMGGAVLMALVGAWA